MKIWVDDIRPALKGYGCTWLTTVNQVKEHIIKCEEVDNFIDELSTNSMLR